MESTKKLPSSSDMRQWIFLGVLIALGVSIAVGMFQMLSTEHDNYVLTTLNPEQEQEVISRNSPLVKYAYLSPHAYFPREDEIRKITIHHMAGNLSLEELGSLFSKRDRTASANYGIDVDGNVGLYVEERNAAWTSSSKINDDQAVTIEVANDEEGGDWHVSDASLAALVELVTDICRRNGIDELIYTGDPSGNLTLHKMFKDTTECPGPYLSGLMGDIAAAVNARLEQSPGSDS